MVTCALAHTDAIQTLLCLAVCSMPISITYILISIFPLFIFYCSDIGHAFNCRTYVKLIICFVVIKLLLLHVCVCASSVIVNSL